MFEKRPFLGMIVLVRYFFWNLDKHSPKTIPKIKVLIFTAINVLKTHRIKKEKSFDFS